MAQQSWMQSRAEQRTCTCGTLMGLSICRMRCSSLSLSQLVPSVRWRCQQQSSGWKGLRNSVQDGCQALQDGAAVMGVQNKLPVWRAAGLLREHPGRWNAHAEACSSGTAARGRKRNPVSSAGTATEPSTLRPAPSEPTSPVYAARSPCARRALKRLRPAAKGAASRKAGGKRCVFGSTVVLPA